MNDKRTALAVLLSIIVIMTYSEFVMQPYLQRAKPAPAATEAPITAAPALTAGTALIAPPPLSSGAAASAASVMPSAAANSAATVAPTVSELDAAPAVLIKTDTMEIHLSALGARPRRLDLTNYRGHLNVPDFVNLVATLPEEPLPLGVEVGGLTDMRVSYSVVDAPANQRELVYAVRSGEELAIPFVGKLSNGATITKTYRVRGDGYLFSVDVAIDDTTLATAPISLDWRMHASSADAHRRVNPLGFKLFSVEDKITTELATGSPEGFSAPRAMKWISFEDKYFMTTMLAATAGPNFRTGAHHLPDESHTIAVVAYGTPAKATFTLFTGPKESSILENAGFELHRNLDLGWFSFLAFPLLWLMRFLESFIHNWGLAIVALTLLIKTAFLPLTKASFKSMRAMQDLQPEMKALRERITDPTQLNQEMMSLYKRRGVNPLGGCFPILIQIPVFIGLYNALLHAIELRHAPFALWVTDLSAPEALMIGPFAVQFMVIILGISMFVQQYLTPTAGLDPLQRKVMLAVPVILSLSFFIYPLPAGLVLYWVVNNTISIVQQVSLKTSRNVSPFPITVVAGLGIFSFAFVLTLL